MLLRPMNRACSLAFAMSLALASWCQVQVDRPVVLTGAVDSLRKVTGLVAASEGTALITADEALQGTVHLARPNGTTNAVALTMRPPAQAYVTGLIVRWSPHVVSAGGLLKVNVDGLGDRNVYRNDGLPVAFGQMEPGTMAEMIYADTAFFLTSRTRSDCPSGFLEVSTELCIQQVDSSLTDVFTAAVYCRQRGARLCTWDEHVLACNTLGQQLSGQFDDWEWIDDTSDHTHTGNQAGRFTCRSHRSMSADLNSNSVGTIRCCYRKP
jgi:hypothetical protein